MENKSLNKYRYTIIIPHYKIINLLGRALQSIPDREDIQILVVDDNSGIERCEFEKAHCQFVLLKENRGAGVARNEALKKTEGQWLFFLDADDFFEEDAFLVFDKYQDSNHDIVYFNTRSVFSDSLLPSNRFSIYTDSKGRKGSGRENGQVQRLPSGVILYKLGWQDFPGGSSG